MCVYTHTMYIYTCMCITESFCCKAEINTTLQINYISIKYNMTGGKNWYISLYVKPISKENHCKQTWLTT